MNLHADLLEQARHLLQREKRRPRQASLRRAVSTAYYALFHLLTADAVKLIAASLPPPAAHRMQRWFDHAEMKRVCSHYLASPLKAPLNSYLGQNVTTDLIYVARAFVQIQEARYAADYDRASEWTRAEARQIVAIAAGAFAAWNRIRKTPEATVFALSLLLWKNFEKER